MALLLLGKTKCPICDEVINETQERVSSMHFIESPAHALWRFSDATMHRECFRSWPRRADFVAEFNRTIGGIRWGNGTRHLMLDDGTIELTHPPV